MARMFPDTERTRVIFSSRAEEQFYGCCRADLPDDWRVYSSCTLSALEGGSGLQDNEIDFVLYHQTYGVVVVEVKGGRVGFDAERATYYSINRFNERFNIKNPFKQVLVWKSRFLRFLRRQGIRVSVCHAVCFPSVAESELPTCAEIEPAIVIGIDGLRDVERTLVRIVNSSRPEGRKNETDVGPRLDALLRGTNFRAKLHLRGYLDNHELRLKDIEVISETLITPIASSRRLAIEGEAGTGKTMLAIMLARQFRDQGKKVLLLSSNPLLSPILRKEAGPRVEVDTYEGLASAYGVDLQRRPQGSTGSSEDWTQFEGPERLREAVAASDRRFDVLICDESQDVQPFWWEALEKLLLDESEGRFYVFFDRSQGVFGSGGRHRGFVAEEVLPMPPPYFPLVHNYRTTREISGFARSFRTGTEILQSHCGRFGYKPEVIVYQDLSDFRRQMKQLFRKLFAEEGLRTNEVAILSARAPFGEGSTLRDTPVIGKYPLVDLTALAKRSATLNPKGARGKVRVSTIPSFKGLETSVGIVVNLSEYRLPMSNPIMSSLVYVACTRAKHMLYLFVREDDPKCATLTEALSKVRQTGSLVIEGTRADYEFAGKITHYNPRRFGWLRVDDPAFERDKIMFFPHDVSSAGLGDVVVGATLIFRPRLDGQLPIAADLRRPS